MLFAMFREPGTPGEATVRGWQLAYRIGLFSIFENYFFVLRTLNYVLKKLNYVLRTLNYVFKEGKKGDFSPYFYF